jgi:hypothetical protein
MRLVASLGINNANVFESPVDIHVSALPQLH